MWILRARDRDRDILARLRFGHQRPLNRRCPARLGHQRPVNHGCPRVSKPVSQDIQSICYCLHTGIFRLDTCDLVVAGVRISISPKYLYLYLALKLLTILISPFRSRSFVYISNGIMFNRFSLFHCQFHCFLRTLLSSGFSHDALPNFYQFNHLN